MSSFRRAVLAAVVACACLPAGASAAVVEYRASEFSDREPFLIYGAGDGERNRLTVGSTSRTVTFSDPGARLRVRKGGKRFCRVRGRHRVVCRRKPTVPIDVFLRDEDDRVRFAGRPLRTRLGRAPRTEVASAGELKDTYSDKFGRAPLTFRVRVRGGDGDDVLHGSRGDDVLIPGGGRNRADGGAGDDRIISTPDGREDRLNGGRGIDTVDLQATGPGILDMGRQTIEAGGRSDRFESMEKGRGGFGDDTLRGSEGADGLFGEDGADRIEGLGGGDYIGGDHRAERVEAEPGIDQLAGGAGDDVLDARDDLDVRGIPERLQCGPGNDTIVAIWGDTADPSCERSGFGTFYGALDDQTVSFDGLAAVQPVGRTAEGAPIYSIACPSAGRGPCRGRLWLADPPARLTDEEAIDYGEATFTIPLGARQNVTVPLTAAGKAALAQPRPVVGVSISMGAPAGGTDETARNSPAADFGWQQQLTP